MIKVILQGRLGSALFQYATGRLLAEINEVPLALHGERLTESEWQDVKQLEHLPLNCSFVDRLKPVTGTLLREGKRREYNPLLAFSAKRDAVLRGHFQAHQYFQNLRSELRQEIYFDEIRWTTDQFRELNYFWNTNSVAVHLKRGNYAGTALDVCSLEYYQKAIEKLKRELDNPLFFLFGDVDDIYFRPLFTEHVFLTNANRVVYRPLYDIYSMSQCKHHIISNTPESWWSAYLGRSPLTQRVLIPEQWHIHPLRHPIRDKLCPGWQTSPIN